MLTLIKKVFLIVIILTNPSWAGDSKKSEVKITKEKALQIAEEKLVKVYSKRVLEQRPFSASLEGSIWKIIGTFHCPKDSVCKGGVAKIDISAQDGSVLHVEHEK